MWTAKDFETPVKSDTSLFGDTKKKWSAEDFETSAKKEVKKEEPKKKVEPKKEPQKPNLAMLNRIDSGYNANLREGEYINKEGLIVPPPPFEMPAEKTPLNQSRYNIVGQNILPRYKEDKPLQAIGKDVLNYGLGTVGRIFGAPQQALMQGTRAAGSAVTGKSQNFSEMTFGKNILGAKEDNLLTTAIGTALDPATYIGGGILDDMARAGQFGKSATLGTTENLLSRSAQQSKLNLPLSKQTATRGYLNAEKMAAKKIKTPDVIYAGEKAGQTTDNLNRLALPAPAKPLRQTQFNNNLIDRPFTATKGEVPNVKKDFKVTTENGAVTVNAATIKDEVGKTAYEALHPDVRNTIEQINKDLDGAIVNPNPDIQSIAQGIKDRSGFSYNIKDVYRNFRQAFGNNYDAVKNKILEPFDNAKKSFVDMQKKYTDSLYDDVVKKFNINQKTNESAAIQWFGEKKKPAKVTDPQTGKKVWTQVDYTLEDLKREFPDKWQNVVEADKWFRTKYDEIIDTVNESRQKIYPNVEADSKKVRQQIDAIYSDISLTDAEKKAQAKLKFEEINNITKNKRVPKRADYYRHFNEMADGFEGVKNLFETPSQIDPSLAGVSEFTKPRSKFAGFMQRRGLGAYKADAVGGFLDYIKASSYATHIDPQISVFRGLAKDIVEGTAKTRNANNFIEYLQDFANDLAGKTNAADRWFQKIIPGGRKTFRILNWINSRVKANTVLGNASSSLSQIANVPQIIAYVKDPRYLAKGAGEYMASIFGKGKAAKLYEKSQFLSERYSGKLYSRFNTNMLDQPKKFAAWMLGVGDELGTKFGWSALYEKAVAEGIKNPIRYADNEIRRLVAGRGVGEMALLQKSKVFQLVAPFQVEVGNLWHVQKDFITDNDFAGLAMLYMANYALNRGMEQVRGSGVVFDPIKAIQDAIAEEDATPLERVGRVAGEVLSNVPLGQTIASAYPEYGVGDLPTRKEFFGREDPTRFGSGILAVKSMQDPLYKLAPPFGGNQIKKTIQGTQALFNKSVGGDKLKYQVDPNAANILRGTLFGQNSFPEAQEYYENNRRPLSKKQTEQVKSSANPSAIYNTTMRRRRIDTLNDKISDIQKNRDLTPEERAKEIKRVRDLLTKEIQK